MSQVGHDLRLGHSEGVTVLLMTDRVMKPKFSQESAEKTGKLTDTAVHNVCQDTHTHNYPACVHKNTQIYKNKRVLSSSKGGFCQAVISEWSPSD